jgi:hypothetical protein
MSALDELIAEQEADLRAGAFQRPQAGTVPLTDVMLKVWGDGGTLRKPMREQHVTCAYHGRGHLIRTDTFGIRCQRCKLDQQKEYRAKNRPARIARQQAWYAKNREQINAKKRAERDAAREERKRDMLTVRPDGSASPLLLSMVRRSTKGNR